MNNFSINLKLTQHVNHPFKIITGASTPAGTCCL